MGSFADSDFKSSGSPGKPEGRESIWLYRCAWAMLLTLLVLTAISGLLVSARTGLPLPEWVGIGQTKHRILAGLVLLFAVALVVLAKRQRSESRVFSLAAAILAVVVLQAVLGMAAASMGQPLAWLGVVQATLMHAAVAGVAAVALCASPSWKQAPVLVENEFRPSLRVMAWWPAVLIAVQIVLGSAYRHGLVGVMPHLVGAMLAAGLLAMAGILVATAYPEHRPLKTAAMHLVWLMAAQVLFGVTALTFRAGFAGAGDWSPNLVLVTVAHIVLGSLTLAACVMLALTIGRHVTDAAVAHAASPDEANAEGRSGARST